MLQNTGQRLVNVYEQRLRVCFLICTDNDYCNFTIIIVRYALYGMYGMHCMVCTDNELYALYGMYGMHCMVCTDNELYGMHYYLLY